MPKTPKGYQRRNSLRYDGYDYTQPGAYSITICAYRGRCVFGQVIDHGMVLNPLGRIADECCHEWAARHERIELNTHMIMPNHLHILFTILYRIAEDIPAKERAFGDAIAGSVSAYMVGIKRL